MNNLLFTALLIALLYYFFYYLPSQKKLTANPPLKHHQSTQTDELESSPENTLHGPEAIPNPKELANLKKDIVQKEKTIIGLNNSYDKLETKTKSEIDKLKQLLQEKANKIKELLETEKTVDQLIKGLQEFNQEID